MEIDKKHQCDVCDHKFSHKEDFREHVLIVHGSMKRFKCGLCPKSYTRPEHLRFHQKLNHEEKKNVKCDLCDMTFADKVYRNRHVKRAHHTIKKCVCPTCDKTFDKPYNLQIHIKVVHLKQRPFECDICKRTFSIKRNLTVHLQLVHKDVNDVKCEHCGKMFKTKTSLKWHCKKTHEARKELIKECRICKLEYKTPDGLRFHIKRVHESVRYTCDFCDSTFSHKDKRRLHVKSVHANSKSFICEICEKVFYNNFDCKEHMWRQHCHGSPSHICHFCAKAFVTLSGFNLHFKRFHGKTNYECNTCDLKFLMKNEYDIHMIQTHENQNVSKNTNIYHQTNGTQDQEVQEKIPSDCTSSFSNYEQSFLETTPEKSEHSIDLQVENVKIDSDSQENQFTEIESTANSVKMDSSNESYINECLPEKEKKSTTKNDFIESKCKCNICGKHFKAIQDLEFHINQCYFQKKEFMAFCPYCKLNYIVRNDQDDHSLNCETLKKLKKLPITITLLS